MCGGETSEHKDKSSEYQYDQYAARAAPSERIVGARRKQTVELTGVLTACQRPRGHNAAASGRNDEARTRPAFAGGRGVRACLGLSDSSAASDLPNQPSASWLRAMAMCKYVVCILRHSVPFIMRGA